MGCNHNYTYLFYDDKYWKYPWCHLELCRRNKELTFSLLCRSLPLPPFPSSPSRFKLIYCVIVSPQRQEINKSNIMCMFSPSILFQSSPRLLKLVLNFFINWEVITGRESQSLTLQAGLGLLHLILIVIQTDIKSSIYYLKSVLPPSWTFPVTTVLLSAWWNKWWIVEWAELSWTIFYLLCFISVLSPQ